MCGVYVCVVGMCGAYVCVVGMYVCVVCMCGVYVRVCGVYSFIPHLFSLLPTFPCSSPHPPQGPEDEFVLVGRLDNLAMSFCCTKALLDACSGEDALVNEGGVRAIALFDHEECGSGSAQGILMIM